MLRIPFIVLGSIFSIFGLYVLCTDLIMISFFIRSKKWPAVPGIIQSSRIEKGYHPAIIYHYEVNGQKYIGRDQYVWDFFDEQYDAQQLVAEYPVGMKVNVFHNPKNPKESTLKTRCNKIPKRDYIMIAIPLVLGALSFFIAFVD